MNLRQPISLFRLTRISALAIALILVLPATTDAQRASDKRAQAPVSRGDEAATATRIESARSQPSAGTSSLACSTGWIPCGASYCSPPGTVCCDSAGHAELYCLAGQTCTTDGRCIGGGGGCSSGQSACGTYCIPAGGQCCNPSNGNYCESGTACTSDGLHCVSTGGGGGGELPCDDGRATQASCGDDSCSCAAVCSRGDECMSGCCANGYCSPSCVCLGQGTLDVNCGGVGGAGGPTFGDDGGCRTAGNGSAIAALLVMSILIGKRRTRGPAPAGSGKGVAPK